MPVRLPEHLSEVDQPQEVAGIRAPFCLTSVGGCRLHLLDVGTEINAVGCGGVQQIPPHLEVLCMPESKGSQRRHDVVMAAPAAGGLSVGGSAQVRRQVDVERYGVFVPLVYRVVVEDGAHVVVARNDEDGVLRSSRSLETVEELAQHLIIIAETGEIFEEKKGPIDLRRMQA